MKYVIDTSVGFKWTVSEIDSDKAIRLGDDFNSGNHELLAPDLFPTEIANALAVAERSGRIKSGEAALFFADVLKSSPILHAAIPLLPRAIDICLHTKQSRSTTASMSPWPKPRHASWSPPTTSSSTKSNPLSHLW